jgi:16S rRNA (cytosine1402-N4)-methyltransferase
MSSGHISVLHQEIRDFAPEKTEEILDLTLGLGGHSLLLLEDHPAARLTGVDRDIQSLQIARKRLDDFSNRFEIIEASFADAVYRLRNEARSFDYIIADLGVSSPQLDQAERGFSFIKEGPLDMRMNRNDAQTAADIINSYSDKQLAEIFSKYGEEKFSWKIATAIVQKREKQAFHSTLDLADLVEKTIPRKFHPKKIHPATRVFQAVRIEVNQELSELDSMMDDALVLLNTGGRLGIISFHSLEDRLVKHRFKKWQNPCECPIEFPVCQCGKEPMVKILTRKPVEAGQDEIELNPRSRSARLRIVEKL